MQLTRSEAKKHGPGRANDVFVFRSITHAYKFDGGEFHVKGWLPEGRIYSPPESATTESITGKGEVSVREVHFLPRSDTEKSHAVEKVELSIYRREAEVDATRFGVPVEIPASLQFMSANEYGKERWWLALALPADQYDKFRQILMAGELGEVRITAEFAGYASNYERDPHYVDANGHGVAECAVTSIECRIVRSGASQSEQREAEVPPEVTRLDALSKQVSESLAMQKYITIALWILVVTSVVMVLR
jgi:hypothetical protein